MGALTLLEQSKRYEICIQVQRSISENPKKSKTGKLKTE